MASFNIHDFVVDGSLNHFAVADFIIKLPHDQLKKYINIIIQEVVDQAQHEGRKDKAQEIKQALDM